MERLREMLKQHRGEFELNLKEGLIKSTPLGKSLSILRKKFPSFKWGVNVKNTSITLRHVFGEEVDWGELLKYVNNLGWFGSIISFKTTNGLEIRNIQFDVEHLNLPLKWVSIHFEAKYDFKVDKIPPKLYHLTPKFKFN